VGNSEKKLPRSGFVHLAKTKGSSISTSITYIAFVTKLQKRQIPEKRFALIKKRYHNYLRPPSDSRYIAVNTGLGLMISNRNRNHIRVIGIEGLRQESIHLGAIIKYE